MAGMHESNGVGGVAAAFDELFDRCRTYTTSTWSQCRDLHTAVRYVDANRVPGAMVECGAWRGGCAMLMALASRNFDPVPRDIYLYDTFTGSDRVGAGGRANHGRDRWRTAPLEDVRINMATTGHAQERVHFVQGEIETTIPATVPGRIALLRLDTGGCDATMHGLEHLYPRLAPGGVLILGEYAEGEGGRLAAEEYFAEHGIGLMLTITDTSAIAVKATPFGMGDLVEPAVPEIPEAVSAIPGAALPRSA